MKKKILPVGSVCKLNRTTNLVMIIGFLPIEISNSFKKYDYYGCSYPSGITSTNKVIYFNKDDIEKVLFTGYESDECKNLLSKLEHANVSIDMKNDDSKKSIFKDVKFDENGVVLIADLVEEETKKITKNSKAETKLVKEDKFQHTPVIASGFIFDEDGYIVKENKDLFKNPFYTNAEEIEKKKAEEQKNTDSSEWSIFKNVEFDENGYVVSVEQNNENKNGDSVVEIDMSNNDDDIIVSNEEEVQAQKKAPISGIKFDENGFVVADGLSNEATTEEVKPTQVQTALSGIKFDENGFVVADGLSNEVTTEEVKQSQTQTALSGIKFDENGFVVADGLSNEVTTEEEKPTQVQTALSGIKFDENGFVVADGLSNEVATEEVKQSQTQTALSGIKFDENGFVVADGLSNEVTTEEVKQSQTQIALSGIKFDENGFVVADGQTSDASIQETKNHAIGASRLDKIKFDENGFIIADDAEVEPVLAEPAPPVNKFTGIKFDENGFVIAENTNTQIQIEETSELNQTNQNEKFSNIKFDENGIIVAE